MGNDMKVSQFALVLWGGQVPGYAPRTTVFEIFYNPQGRMFGRKLGTKGYKPLSDDQIVAEFATCEPPDEATVRRAKRMFHKNWHRKQAQGVQP